MYILIKGDSYGTNNIFILSGTNCALSILSIAAEELHVSQPALSTGIKKLEEQLGVKLLERTYKGVTLTPEGKEIVTLAEKAFDYLDQIETKYQNTLSQNDKHPLEDLKIYCNPAYSQFVMSALTAGKKFDNRIIQLYDLAPGINPKQLIKENTDIVILGIIADTHNLPADISAAKLCTSQAYIMCSKEFPYIASNKTSISFKELLDIPLSILDPSLEFQKILLQQIHQYGVPQIKVVSSHTNTVSTAVQNGVAAGFSNKFFHSPRLNDLRYIPIRNAPKFHLSLVSHYKTDKEKINSLIAILKPLL